MRVESRVAHRVRAELGILEHLSNRFLTLAQNTNADVGGFIDEL